MNGAARYPASVGNKAAFSTVTATATRTNRIVLAATAPVARAGDWVRCARLRRAKVRVTAVDDTNIDVGRAGPMGFLLPKSTYVEGDENAQFLDASSKLKTSAVETNGECALYTLSKSRIDEGVFEAVD